MVRFGPNPFPVLSFRRQSYVISGNNLFLVCLLFIQLSFYFKSLFIGNVIRFQMGKVHFSLVSFWTSRVYEMNHGYWFTPVLQFTRVFGDCLWNLWNRFFSGLRFLIACVVWLISSACFVNSKGNDLEKPLNLEWLRRQTGNEWKNDFAKAAVDYFCLFLLFILLCAREVARLTFQWNTSSSFPALPWLRIHYEMRVDERLFHNSPLVLSFVQSHILFLLWEYKSFVPKFILLWVSTQQLADQYKFIFVTLIDLTLALWIVFTFEKCTISSFHYFLFFTL